LYLDTRLTIHNGQRALMILDAVGACALDLELQFQFLDFKQSWIGKSQSFDLLGLRRDLRGF
jgi:hypothetical protein